MADSNKISVVVPCYNEEGNIPVLYDQLRKILNDYTCEYVFVDDGSTDNSLVELKKLTDKDQNVKYISLSRNFGHQNALKAGYDHATGDCVISLDADLQHPPAIIPDLIEKWKHGYDVVYTIRKYNKEIGLFKKITSAIFYAVINRLSDTDIHQGAADFRLLDKKVIDELRKLNENYLFIRGLISWLGFKQYAIEYTANERESGHSKYSFKRMLKFASSGITAFSVKPLKVSILLGFIIAIVTFIYGLYAIYISIFTTKEIPGWTSTIVSVLFIGGVQLIMIGILGEYLGKLFIENKRRPNYIIKEKYL